MSVPLDTLLQESEDLMTDVGMKYEQKTIFPVSKCFQGLQKPFIP